MNLGLCESMGGLLKAMILGLELIGTLFPVLVVSGKAGIFGL